MKGNKGKDEIYSCIIFDTVILEIFRIGEMVLKTGVYFCGVLCLLHCVMKISLIQNVKLVHGRILCISILG
jgi:hypothetical protein